MGEDYNRMAEEVIYFLYPEAIISFLSILGKVLSMVSMDGTPTVPYSATQQKKLWCKFGRFEKGRSGR